MYQPEAQYFLHNQFSEKTEFDKFLDYLLSFQDDLRKDFFRNDKQSIADIVKQEGFENARPRTIQQFHSPTEKWAMPKESRYALADAVTVDGKTDYSGWTSTQIKYFSSGPDKANDPPPMIWVNKRFPTAAKLIKEFGDDCPIMDYVMLKPKTILSRHTGATNIGSNRVRIHLPIFVPEGRCFLEINGKPIYWKDGPFGFNDEYVHSACNLTDEYRVIWMMDMERDKVGLPFCTGADKTLNKPLDEEIDYERI